MNLGKDEEPQRHEPMVIGQATSEPADARKLFTALMRRFWLMLGIVVLVCALGTGYMLTRRKTYESTAKILVIGGAGAVARPINEVAILSDVQALTRARSVNTRADIISSPDLLQEAYKSLPEEMRKSGFGSNWIPGWSYRIGVKKDTDIVTVTCRAYTPEAAAALANSVADTYFERDTQQNNQITRQARQYTEKKLIATARQQAAANKDLAEYKQQTGLFAADAQSIKAAEQIAQLRMEADIARVAAASAQQSVDSTRGELSRQQKDVVSSTNLIRNPLFGTVLERINNLQGERTNLLQEYTPKAIEVMRVDEAIRQQETRLKEIAQVVVGSKLIARNPIRDTIAASYATQVALLASAGARVQALDSELNKREEASQQLPEQQRQLAERLQKIATLQRTYDMLQNKYQTLLMSEEATMPPGFLISKADKSIRQTFPRILDSALSFFFLGLALAALAALAANHLDRRTYDQDTIERISGLDTLGIIPQLPKHTARLLNADNCDSLHLESFRMLRNTIRLVGRESQSKIIAITSPSRGDGKSTTAINLAVAIAIDGKRVLLVDADGRRPELHNLLEIPDKPGLSNIVMQGSKCEDGIRPTRISNLHCLPSGESVRHLPEMLNSQACHELFAQLGKQYDAVIVDCPPAAGLSDMQIISGITDGIILVVSMRQALRLRLIAAVKMLNQAQAPIFGLVLNRMNPRNIDNTNLIDYSNNAKRRRKSERDESEARSRVHS